MTFLMLLALLALIRVCFVLARLITADGYGTRSSPRTHDDQADNWRMPHDEPRRSVR